MNFQTNQSGLEQRMGCVSNNGQDGRKLYHSHDLWGDIVNQEVMGPRVLTSYRKLMTGHIDQETLEQNVHNYSLVLQGDKTVDKPRSVAAVEEPLWEGYFAGEVSVDFSNGIYSDALRSMRSIVDAGQGLVITTTGKSDWIKKALREYDVKIAEAIEEVYHGDKSQAAIFEKVYADIQSRGGVLVSHTEDQMKGFSGLLKSSIADKIRKVYVERAKLATREEVEAEGIEYVTDLSDVDYTSEKQYESCQSEEQDSSAEKSESAESA